MKTIINNHLKEECENSGGYYFSQSSLVQLQATPLAAPQKTSEQKNLKNSLSKGMNHLQQSTARIGQEVVTESKKYIQSRKVSGRIIIGIFLAGSIAPLSDVFYAFEFMTYFEGFRLETKIKDYYYSNYRYLFMCLGPYLYAVFTVIGVYMTLVPEGAKKSWLVSIPLGLPIIKILWLLQVKNSMQFHQIPTLAYIIYGFVVASCLWFISKCLAYLLNHRKRNAESTMDNITNNRKAFPADQAVEMYATTWNKLRSI